MAEIKVANVSLQLTLSEACNVASQCSDVNAECDSFCRCKAGYFDSNGFTTSGGTCLHMSYLKVTMLTFSSVSSSGVILSWTPPTYSSQVSSYTAVWRLNGSSTVEGNMTVGNNVTTANITGLTQGTDYVFSVVSKEIGSRAEEQEIESNDTVTLSTNAILSEACGGSVVCDDGKSECIAGDTGGGNVCRCQSGYYDNNGFSTAGGVCTSMNDLMATMLTFSSVTSSGVILSWTAPSNFAQVSTYTAVWRLNGSSTVEGNMTVGNNVTTANITGLTQGTDYVFSVVSKEIGSRAEEQEIESNDTVTLSTNAILSEACGGSVVCDDGKSECIAGDTGGGNVCRCQSGYYDNNGFSTAGGVCTSMNDLMATMLTFSSVTSSGVILSWTAPSNFAQVSTYTAVWRLNGSSTVEGNMTVGNNVTTANITGLTQGTDYVFSVVSKEIGSRAEEQEIESNDTVTLSTNAILSEACGGSVVCDDGKSECIAGDTGGGNVCRCQSGYYDNNGFSTAGGVCTSMNDLMATMLTFSSVTSSGVILSWTAPSNFAQVSTYTAVWRLNGSSTVEGNMTVGNNVTTANITGLTQGTDYVFSVVSKEIGSRAEEQEIESNDTVTLSTNAILSEACGGSVVCDDGKSECIAGDTGGGNVCRCQSGYYDNNGFSTAGGVCTSMNDLMATMLTLSSVTSSGVILSWTAPSNFAQVSTYTAVWRLNGSSTVEGNMTVGNNVTTANITGLTQGTDYVFSVVSKEIGSRAEEQEIESNDTVTLSTNAILSEACGGSVVCDDGKSECIAGDTGGGNVCRCQSGYYDNNGFSTAGGVCTSMNDLMATMLTFSSVTSSGVILSWTAPSNFAQVSTYTAVWRLNGSSTVEGNMTVGNNVTTANITGLTQGTDYVFSVVSKEIGSRAEEQEIESNDTVTLSTNAILSEACGGSVVCDDGKSECIAGDTGGGNVCRCQSGYYDNNGFSTAGGVCTSMNDLMATMLTLSSVTSSGVILSWTAPSNFAQVSTYTAVWRLNGSSTVEGNMTVGNNVTTANITGLTQGTDYVFSVVSKEIGSRAEEQEIESNDTVTLSTNAILSEACGGSVVCDDGKSECIAGDTGGGNVCRCQSGYYDNNGFSTAGGVCTSMNDLMATMLTLSSVTSSGVILSWTAPSNFAQVSTYTAVWRLNGSSTVEGNMTVGNNVTTANITGLTQGTDYVFSVVSKEIGSRAEEQEIESNDTVTLSTNAILSEACGGSVVCDDGKSECIAGDTGGGNVCRCQSGYYDNNGFSTAGGVCTSMNDLMATMLTLSSVTSSGVILSWTAPSNFAQVSTYTAVWRLNGSSTVEGNMTVGNNVTTANITGLTQGTDYVFSVVSKEIGSRAEEQEIESNDTVTLSTNAILSEACGGSVVCDDGKSECIAGDTGGGNVCRCQSGYYDNNGFSTAGGVCTSMNDLMATMLTLSSVTSSGVILSWTAPSNFAQVSTYTAVWRLNGSSTVEGNMTVGNNVTTANITGLTQGTDYVFSVVSKEIGSRAEEQEIESNDTVTLSTNAILSEACGGSVVCDDGKSECIAGDTGGGNVCRCQSGYYDNNGFSTAGGVCTSMNDLMATMLTLSSVTSSGVILSWTAPSNFAQVSTYTAVWRLNGSSTVEGNMTVGNNVTTANITGLTQGTDYVFSVVSKEIGSRAEEQEIESNDTVTLSTNAILSEACGGSVVCDDGKSECIAGDTGGGNVCRCQSGYYDNNGFSTAGGVCTSMNDLMATMLTLSSVTSSGVILSWTAPSNFAQVSTYTAVWRLNGSSTVEGNMTVGNNVTTANITGLTQGTDYVFSVVSKEIGSRAEEQEIESNDTVTLSTNAILSEACGGSVVCDDGKSECIAGDTGGGNVCRCQSGYYDNNGFSTAGGVCTSMNDLMATMLTLSSVTSSGVILSWTAPSNFAQVSTYTAVWRLNGSSTVEGNMTVGNNVTTANITGLTQGTDYVFSVVSKEIGSRAEEQEIESNDTVTLSTNAILSEACGGSVVCDDGKSECIAGDTGGGNVCRCQSGYYDNNGFSTAGGVCTSMNDLMATMLTFSSVTSSGVILSWTAPSNFAQVSTYTAVWRLNGSSTVEGNMTVGNNVTTANITGLTQGTDYVFSVVSKEIGSRAEEQEIESNDTVTLSTNAILSEACGGSVVCDDGKSECIAGDTGGGNVCRCQSGYYDNNGFSTAGGVCTSMNDLMATMLTFSSVTSSGVILSWTAPSNFAQVSTYTAVWRLNGSSTVEGNMTVGNNVTTANITGLTQGTDYVFSVVSKEIGSRAEEQEIESNDTVTLSTNAILSEACGGSVVCDDGKSECIAGDTGGGNVCRCQSGYYDNNGFSTAGGVCTSMNDLMATMLTLSSVTSSGVILSWTAPSNFAQVSTYTAVWRLNGSSTVEGNMTVGNNVTTANITGLTQGTDYVFSVVSKEIGSRAEEQEIESNDTVTLSTNAILSEACGGSVVCDDGKSECIAGDTGGGNVCRCQSGYYDNNGFSTAGGVCTSMNDLMATMLTLSSVTSSGVILSWTAPSNFAQVSTYTAVWRLNGSSTVEGNMTVGNNVTTANITGLTQGTDYVFSVVSKEIGSRAEEQEIESNDTVTLSTNAILSEACGGSVVCDDGKSECIAGDTGGGNVCRCQSGYYDNNGFSTAGGVCTSMNDLMATILTLSSVTSSGVILSWTAPSNFAQVSTYTAVWRLNGSSTVEGNMTVGNNVTTANITGLTQGTDYVFSVVSKEIGSRAEEQEIESNDTVTLSTNAILSEACGGSVVCDDGKSECIAGDTGGGNVCRCQSGYYDNNGFSTAGGVCTSMNDLMATMLTLSSVTSSGVILSWTAPSNFAQVSTYTAVWRLNGSSTVEGNMTVGNNVTTANITGLTQGTDYVFSVVSKEIGSRAEEQEIESNDTVTLSTNAILSEACGGSVVCDDGKSECIAGDTGGGNVCRCQSGYYDNNGFSTAGGVCTSMNDLMATMLTLSSVTSSGVILSWTAPSNFAQVSTYTAVWRLNGSSTVEGNMTVGNNVTTANITGLTQGTDYVFSVVSKEIGSRAEEQEIESNDTVTLSTNAILSEACGGSVVCDDGKSECIAGDTGGGNVCRCQSGYYDNNGFGTAGGVCTSMNDLMATMLTLSSVTSSGVILSWTAPSNFAQVSTYTAVWRFNGSSTVEGNMTVGNNVTTANITGLTQGTDYVFSVVSKEIGSRAEEQEIESNDTVTLSTNAILSEACGGSVVCDDGKSECIAGDTGGGNVCRCQSGYYDNNGFGTAGGVCTSMNDLMATMLTLSSVTSSGVILSWTAPSNFAQVSTYTAVWRFNGSSTVEGNMTVGNNVTTANITGLTQGTDYVFSVVSKEIGSRAEEQEIESNDTVTLSTNAILSEACGGSVVCDDGKSECIAGDTGGGNVCRCQSGYYDNNGFSTAGGVCTSNNGLVVTNFAVGVDGISTVTIEWLAPSDGSDIINRYEIHWTPLLSNGTGSYNAGNGTNARLTGFVSGQQYAFHVKTIELGSRNNEQEVQTKIKYITMDAGLSVPCNVNETVCADFKSNCTQSDIGLDTICRCMEGWFDSNGFNQPGGMCISMSTLAATGLSVLTEGMDTVKISWTPPSEYINQVNRYEVGWIPATAINGSLSYDARRNSTVHLEGFTPGQTYTFAVYSVESGSRRVEQNTSSVPSNITMKPHMPSEFTETDVDGPVITLTWKLPDGVKTSYEVVTAPTLGMTSVVTESITFNVSVLDGQWYNISITTISGSERSDPLNSSFTTVAKTPDPPVVYGSTFCNATTNGSITLSWTAPVNPRGNIQYYLINSTTTGVIYDTQSSQTTYEIDGLQPGESYIFSVALVNDAVLYENQSDYSTPYQCRTEAAMALKPATLVISQVQSREFILNWTKPTVSNGALSGYRLTVTYGDACVQEVGFICNECQMWMPFLYKCAAGDKDLVIIPPEEIDDAFSYSVQNLLPYTNYTVILSAVNTAGDGLPITQSLTTHKEVPQNPTDLNALVLSSTEIYVTWNISEPSPGPTQFALHVIAETPEVNRTEIIQGFHTRSFTVENLEEFRIYTFNITASTDKGSAGFRRILPSATTHASAPGIVDKFLVFRPDGLDFATVRVSWRLPALLDRNSNITDFVFSYNTSGSNESTSPEVIVVGPDPSPVTRNIKVVPLHTYNVEVYAVGMDATGNTFVGSKSSMTYFAPAGPPPLDIAASVIPPAMNTDIKATYTTFTLTLDKQFFINDTHGPIVDYALVLCRETCTGLGEISETKGENYLNLIDGWIAARAKGATRPYRAMSKAEFDLSLFGNRTSSTFRVVIGEETNCSLSNKQFCNGPLTAETDYM
ncbi:uncharacterized protein LOC132550258 [Ylistrum balloti]|uniref:uncharacterized protein LOC132550258 n=1 Tax=Ylistrum balloti TaxID=509963 RepID=UPI002905C2C8|nr:uncharacterized protein LOC132550258 [Ylistrum balloti]